MTNSKKHHSVKQLKPSSQHSYPTVVKLTEKDLEAIVGAGPETSP